MRNFFYALVLVSVVVFGFFISSKSFASGDVAGSAVVNFPYKIIEVKPTGERSETAGASANIAPEKIITDLGLPYYLEDKISTLPDPKLRIGGVVTINRAAAISVKDGKKLTIYRSWGKTAGELLLEKNIELGTDDKTSFQPDSQIFDGSQLTIVRVAITTVVEVKAIDFQILQKDDPNLDYGKKRVEAGGKGEKKLTYRVRREDGEEVERTLIDSQVTKNPKSEIHYTGTKVTILSSVRGRATRTNIANYIVSANYPRGTLVRINANGVSIIGMVNVTWGTATPPDGIVLDLSQSYLSQLKCSSSGCPSVLVEEIKQ